RRRAAEWSERGHALSSLCDPEPAGYSVRHPAGSVAASGRDTLANDSARDLGIQSGANDLERLTGEIPREIEPHPAAALSHSLQPLCGPGVAVGSDRTLRTHRLQRRTTQPRVRHSVRAWRSGPRCLADLSAKRVPNEIGRAHV